MPIDINGDVIDEITIDGEFTEEVTVDGEVVFKQSSMPVAYSNLVAWFPFNNDTNTAADATAGDSDSGDSTDYTASGVDGSPTYLSNDGVNDGDTGAYSFNPNEAFYDVNRSNDGPTLNDFTMVMSFRNLDSEGVLHEYREGGVGAGIDQDRIWRVDYTDSTLTVDLADASNSSNDAATSFSISDTSNWTNIAFRRNGTNFELFRDGSSVDSTTGGTLGEGDQWSFAARTTDSGGRNSWVNCELDDIRWYNTALSDSQISDIANKVLP